MGEMNQRFGPMARFFPLLAAACLASGAAHATCAPTLPITAASVPCYIKVQPIDVGTIPSGTTPVYAPFNTTSLTGNPSTAGTPFSTNPLLGINLPNNPTSANPIGFVVNPATGLFPGQSGYVGPGVDVTRVLLNNIGVDLVWLSMNTYVTPGPNNMNPSQNFTTLNVTVAPVTPTQIVAMNCTGFISGTTLTITSACTAPGALAVYDFLSSAQAAVASGTYIGGLSTGSGGTGTYTVNISQTVGSSKKPVSFTATAGTLGSTDLLTLADQNPSTHSPPTSPCSISQMTIPSSSPCGGPAPSPPLSSDPGTINMFFVNKLNPPISGGTLYGFSLICNNGVAIGGNTFFAPTPLQARPDTIAHELLHDLCLTHDSMTLAAGPSGPYGAGPWTPPTNGSYTPPAGVVPPVPNSPFNGECDPNYPACGINLMTSGDLRTEPTITCVLNGYMGVTTPGCSGQPSFPNQTADQVTIPAQESATNLPESQQREVLTGMSGLLNCNPLYPGTCNPIQIGGLIDPIPYETTKAQLETGGPGDRVIFDLPGPVDGQPGETLVAWVLSLPEGQAFARQDSLHILSQSRKDLVEDVNYYPNPVDSPLMRKTAYNPGADNKPEDPGIGAAGSSPCAATTAACLIVKFQAPGLGTDDSISFSDIILSGGAPITKDDLCKAKITYMFSDGYMTTSNFGRCPPASPALIASSWHPDPHVAPHFVKSNVLLAQGATTLPCTPVNGACMDPSKTPPADADPTTEGGQLSQSCDNGATFSNTVSGIIKASNVIITGNQSCNYMNCEFLGSLTINGARAFLKNCQVDGNLTMNSGTLNLAPPDQPNQAPSVLVFGNVQIGTPQASLSNMFAIGPGTGINGGLTIQNLASNMSGYLPSNVSGLVCGSTVSGGVTVNNNQSSIEIGTGAQPNCGGNRISGGLNCKGNTGTLTGGSNTVSGGKSGQCVGF